jgi:predicted MFS family arabinose efflux permease
MSTAFEDASTAPLAPRRLPPITAAGWLILMVLAAVQFTHIMDFMIIMPLGPRYRTELNITPQEFGFLVSAYAFSACVSGLIAAFVIDRFDRKRALLFLYGGFTVGTLLCAVAPGFLTLLLARCVAGAFGGVIGAVSLAVIGDVFPEERRGLATGVVMSSFSLATVAGVPAGLSIADIFHSNSAPFAVLGVLSACMLVLACYVLPPQRRHLDADSSRARLPIRQVLVIPAHIRAYLVMTCLVLSTFMIIPFLSMYVVANTGYRESDLRLIYFTGGAATLVTMSVFGRVADHVGKLLVCRILVVLAMLPLLLLTNFDRLLGLLPSDSSYGLRLGLTLGATTLFFILTSGRMVPAMALITSSAAPAYRGSFLSIVSSVQQMASGLASLLAGLLLTQADQNGPLVGFPLIGVLGCFGSLAALVLVGQLTPATGTPLPPFVVAEEVAEGLPTQGIQVALEKDGMVVAEGVQ